MQQPLAPRTLRPFGLLLVGLALFTLGAAGDCAGGSRLSSGVDGAGGSGSNGAQGPVGSKGDSANSGSSSGSTGGDGHYPAAGAGTPAGSGSGSGGSTEAAGNDTSPGVLGAGESCARQGDRDERCMSGLACAAGRCVKDGELRITLSWSDDTDLDLHLKTPSGEVLNFENRVGDGGGRLEKDSCVNNGCENQDSFVESAFWVREPPEGTYEFWAANYNGDSAATAHFDAEVEGRRVSFDGSVAAAEGATSQTFAISVGDDGRSNFEFMTPSEGARTGKTVTFRIDTDNPDVERVEYAAGDNGQHDLGGSSDASTFYEIDYTFTQFGERTIRARGFDGRDFEVANTSITINVQDPNGCRAPGPSGNTAQCILNHHNAGNIELYPRQVSGRDDGADALSNIRDAAAGMPVQTSNYGNAAPHGATTLNEPMLQAMVELTEDYGYSFRVTSVAGGSHSPSSAHYFGQAFDIDRIDGVKINGVTHGVRSLSMACTMLGASNVLGPHNDGSHSSHIHCRW